MKKLLGLILLGSLAACGNNAGEKPADNSTTNDTPTSRLTNDSISIPHERDRTVNDTAQNSNVTRSSDSTAP
jgi:hypothetical protein